MINKFRHNAKIEKNHTLSSLHISKGKAGKTATNKTKLNTPKLNGPHPPHSFSQKSRYKINIKHSTTDFKIGTFLWVLVFVVTFIFCFMENRKILVCIGDTYAIVTTDHLCYDYASWKSEILTMSTGACTRHDTCGVLKFVGNLTDLITTSYPAGLDENTKGALVDGIFKPRVDLNAHYIHINYNKTGGDVAKIGWDIVGFFGKLESKNQISGKGEIRWYGGIGTVPTGSGTETDPYIIDDKNDLLYLSLPQDWSYITGEKYYELTCDLTIDYGSDTYFGQDVTESVQCASESGDTTEFKAIRNWDHRVVVNDSGKTIYCANIWNSIGTATSQFNGHFNGNGHKITLLNVSEPLFGYTTDGAVYDLDTENVLNPEHYIVYNLDGGTMVGGPAYYTSETETFTLPTPTKSGYIFLGWTGSNGSTPEKVVTITQGSSGNRSYTANWGENVLTLTLTCSNYIDQKFAIYVMLANQMLKQIYVDRRTITLKLNVLDEDATDPYTLMFVYGYWGSFDVSETDNAESWSNITLSGRKIVINTLSTMTITYTLTNPEVNTKIVI